MGAAYIFTPAADTGLWTQSALLQPSSTGAGAERLGFSVAAGLDTVVIGAPNAPSE